MIYQDLEDLAENPVLGFPQVEEFSKTKMCRIGLSVLAFVPYSLVIVVLQLVFGRVLTLLVLYLGQIDHPILVMVVLDLALWR
jgi:hypothetical protein